MASKGAYFIISIGLKCKFPSSIGLDCTIKMQEWGEENN